MVEQKKVSLDSIYCVAYGLFLAGTILGQTLLPVNSFIRYFMIGMGVTLIIFILGVNVIRNTKISKRRVIIYCLFIFSLIISLISVQRNREYELLSSVLFIFSSENINFKSILKTFISVTVAVLAIMLVAYALGIIGNGTIQRQSSIGTNRITFGYRSATDLVQLVSYILLADIVLWYEGKGPIHTRIFIYFFLGLVSWFFTDSRLASFSIVIMIPLIIILKYADVPLNNKILNIFLSYSFEICLFVSVFIMDMFMKYHSSVLMKIDVFSSARLTNTEMGIKCFNYSLWGQDIYTRILQYWSGWFYIDSSYYTFLLEYGIALLCIVMLMYTATVKKELRSNDIVIPIVMAMVSIESMICREYFLIEYNVFLLAFLANTKIGRKNELNN